MLLPTPVRRFPESQRMWHFVGSKKNKCRIIKAVDRATGRTVAWVTGHRDVATFRRLYDKLKHLTACVFYTDDWDAFAAVLPKGRHVVGKAHTVTIERDNSNNRHHLAPMTRRTKVVSRSEAMVNVTLKLWFYLTLAEYFAGYQNMALSIFK